MIEGVVKGVTAAVTAVVTVVTGLTAALIGDEIVMLGAIEVDGMMAGPIVSVRVVVE